MLYLNDWISRFNVDQEQPRKNYSKGWWENIEFIKLFTSQLDINEDEIFVLEGYEIGTPPPEETLILPLIVFEMNRVKFYLKSDFSTSGFFDSWLISVDCQQSLIDVDLSKYINDIFIEKAMGNSFKSRFFKPFIKNNILFENYKKYHNKFSGTVATDLDLYCLLKIINNNIDND